MRSFSDLLLLFAPACLAVLLIGLFTAPLSVAGLSLAPNVAWVLTLALATRAPGLWPLWLGFLLGLLQDILFGTPLGAQGLLTLALTALSHHQAQRQHLQAFYVRWLEAAGALLLWHGLLWCISHAVSPQPLPLWGLLETGILSAVWYPVFYAASTRLFLRRDSAY